MAHSNIPASASGSFPSLIRWSLATLSLVIPFIFDPLLSEPFQNPKQLVFRWGALLLLGLWLGKVLTSRRIDLPRIPILVPMLFIVFIALLSIFPAANAVETSVLVRDLCLGAIVILIGTRALLPSSRAPAVALGTAGVAASTLGLLQILLGPRFDFLPLTQGGSYLGDVTIAAMFVAILIPLLLSLSSSSDRTFSWLWGVGSGAAIGFVLLSRTRGAWLALVVGWVAWLALKSWSRGPGDSKKTAPGSETGPGPGRWLVPALITVLVLMVVGTQVMGIHMFSAPPSTRMSALQGLELQLLTWEATVKMVLAHPLGVGIGNWASAFPSTAGTLGPHSVFTLARYPGLASNEYLQIAAEMGLAGLIIFLWFLFRLFASTIGRKDAGAGPLGRGSVAGLMGLAAGCLLSSPLRAQPTAWAAVMLICLALASVSRTAAAGDTAGASFSWEFQPERRRLMAGMVILLFLGLVGLSGWNTYQALITEKLIRQGQGACLARDYSTALPRLDRAGEISPHSFRAHYLAGVCALEAGKVEMAEKELFAARKLNRNDARTLLAQASTFKARGNLIDAVGACERARDLWPLDETVQLTAGEVFEAAGDLRAASAAYRTVIGRNPGSVKAHLRLAGILERDDRGANAISIFSKAASLDPYNAEALFLLARSQLSQGMFELALQVFRRLLALAPESSQTRLGLGRALAGVDRHCEAANQFAVALTLDLDPSLRKGVELTRDEYQRKCDSPPTN